VNEVPLSKSGFAWSGLRVPGRVVVTDDRTGVAAAVVTRLSARGIKSEVVNEVPADARVVILLHGLRDVKSVADAIELQRDAFLALKAVAGAFEKEIGAVVSVQDSGGDFGLRGADPARAWTAGLAALVRTFALECPRAVVRSIDCERGSQSTDVLADKIVSELFEGGSVQEVGLRADGVRNALVATESQTHEGKISLSSDSVIVVSGGARGVTAACTIELAKQCKPKFILLGRTALESEPACTVTAVDEGAIKRALIENAKVTGEKLVPAAIGKRAQEILAAREVMATLSALEKWGSKAAYRAVDVRDSSQIRAALDELRPQFGAVTGLLHAAGVLADKMLKEKTVEQFDRVFDTKVRGLSALLDAVSQEPLTMICMFSSIAARTGNAGQSDYAMANEVLNAVACAERAKRGASCVVRSIGWGPWEGGMVTPTLRDHFTERGVPLISLAGGACHFVDELRSQGTDTISVVARSVGAGALGVVVPKTVVSSIELTDTSHLYLNDHKVAGAAVVPVAIVVEWCLRFGRDLCPEFSNLAVENIRVMKSIRLTKGAATVIEMRGAVEHTAHGATVAVELRDAKNVLLYTARIVMGAQVNPQMKAQAQAPASLERYAEPTIYDGYLLFHGPLFQTLAEIEGISSAGAVGHLKGMAELGWSTEGWQSDPATNDGALQLAVLWARKAIAGPTLPMSVGAVRIHDASRTATRGVVRAREAGSDRTLCDVFLVADDSTILTEFNGIETIRRPDTPSA